MADRKDDARLYGMPDPSNRQPPGEEGMRGEQGAQGRPDLTHTETLPDGNRVAIEEESGTAFAEVTGRAGRARPADEDSSTN